MIAVLGAFLLAVVVELALVQYHQHRRIDALRRLDCILDHPANPPKETHP